MATYEIRNQNGGFAVYTVRPRQVTETTIRDGQIEQKTKTYREVFRVADPSIFYTYYEGNDNWDTDIDCGAQRWRGNRTTAEIKAALKKCGFSKKEIQDTIGAAKTTSGIEDDPKPELPQNVKIRRLGGNKFEVSDGELTVFVSYETPVAILPNDGTGRIYLTSTRWSRSTEQHISDFKSGRPLGSYLPQEDLDKALYQLIGDTRLRDKARAVQLGQTRSTDGVSGHTEPGDKNLVFPVYRRH